MRQLYYTLQTLIRGKGSNVIKVVSLGLGLAVSILIFAREAFEFNYDTCYKEHERLYVIKTIWHYNGEDHPSSATLGPVAGAIAESMPEEVESVTVTQQWWWNSSWFCKDRRFQTNAITADSCFFATVGIDLVSGDPRELNNPEVVFLSRQMARDMFADNDPIGQTVIYNKQIPMTVKGVFEDLPENSSLYGRGIVMSLATSFKHEWGYWGWDGGDGYLSFVRLRPGVQLDDVNRKIAKLVEEMRKGENTVFCLTPVKDFRMEFGVSSMRMVWILLALGATILFIVTMNYILISISSMSRRAKAIGVHKCNGASMGTIFGMFMWETAFILLLSLSAMALLLIYFRQPLEDMLDVSLAGLFSWQNLWAPASVLAFLFVVGGVLPGQLFARIPVTQVFRRYTEGKKSWKRPLLFVQFAGVAFIFGLMALVYVQSRYIQNKERGYDYHNVAYATDITFESNSEGAAARAAILSLPYVENGASSNNLPTAGLSGEYVDTDGGDKLSVRLMEFTKEYAPLMNLKFVAGKNLAAPGEILVNETFLKMMHWEENPVGRQVRVGGEIVGNVVGVLKDFATADPAYDAVQPLGVVFQDGFRNTLQLRLKEPFDDNLKQLNVDIEKAFPTSNIVFSSFPKLIEEQNRAITDFRNATTLAAITILFITLMGLIGYINDEMQRRSKEIAIRKVNGAEASSILRLLSFDVFWTSLPAILLGTVGAWFMGDVWIEQFAESVNFPVWAYVVIAIMVQLLIIGCVVFKVWRIANENPVKSIKSE